MNPLILSLCASISTLIGFVMINCTKKDIIKSSFALASGVMISVSIFDLIPESFIKLNGYFNIIPAILIMFIFFSLGVIISMLIDKYIISDKYITYT